MKNSFLIIGAVLLFASAAAATDVPTAETFLGYNLVRFNPNPHVFPSFNAEGGGGQFAYNFSKWFSGVVDLGAVTKGSLGGLTLDSTVVNFVAGPRVTMHNHSRFTPFVQVLFGGVYATSSSQISLLPTTGPVLPGGIVLNPNLPVTARLVASRTGFAMLAGGGLDIKISKNISFRPIGADYYLTRLPRFLTGNDTNVNNFRYSAGVNFLFGAK
jgi:opacity protein-like surface antigen